MFLSGLVKLTSGDPSWWTLRALDYHYWTQPLPTFVGWWTAHAPEWFQQLSTAFVLIVEVAGAFLIWLPRRLRVLDARLFILLQILIALTGNYAFFNLLTIALCLLLIDDYAWPGVRTIANAEPGLRWPVAIPALVLLVTMPINALLLYAGFYPAADWPRPITALYQAIEPFRIVNGYGLFRVMTKERPEITIEGSADAVTWQPYVFKWKAGPLSRRPGFVEPYQPRLDWQMWFAALGSAQQNPWFVALAVRLLHNEPAVVDLLAKNPFPDKPPRYLRAEISRYRFATIAEHRRTGAWWTRGVAEPYLPVVSLGAE
jgi:hypothetical protein